MHARVTAQVNDDEGFSCTVPDVALAQKNRQPEALSVR